MENCKCAVPAMDARGRGSGARFRDQSETFVPLDNLIELPGLPRLGASNEERKSNCHYPRPKDTDAFEHIYQSEHVPLVVARLAAKTKMVATKVLASPQGTPPF
jgi:hypothetical protein